MSSECNDRLDPATAECRHLILGTAGHIDHGKTALVKALTGVDADRLPEEQARGMTIELGFAHLALEDVQFGVVDVPGHEKFVRTMVAGATGIDVVMLVVAADDSVMPQTREHVDILRLLNVRHGVVAISKCDLVDSEMADLVEEEIRELLATTTMADFPIVRVSAHAGTGLDTLRATLRDLAVAAPQRAASSVFRLSIDRVFTVHGRGTVVTGSATSGRVDVGATLALMPHARPCKVRGLQTHNDQADSLELGRRVALNLAGLDRDDVQRGAELATPGYLTPSRLIDVRLNALAANPRPLKQHLTARLCLGTAEYRTRLRLLGPRVLEAEDSACAQLLSAVPLSAAWGQHYILRDDTNARTLGGGIVLRPVSRRLRAADTVDTAGLEALQSSDAQMRAAEVLRFDAIPGASHLQLACQSGVDPQDIPDLLETLAKQKTVVRIGTRGILVATARVEACREHSLKWLRRFHERSPDEPGCPRDALVGWLKRKWGVALAEHLLELLLRKQVKTLGRFCCLREFAPKMSHEDEQLLQHMVQELGAAGYQPPAAAALAAARNVPAGRLKKLVKIAVASGQLVDIGSDILLHPQAFEGLKSKVVEHMADGSGLTVADVRNMLNSSRKFVVPLLEHLDRIGFTKRVGDQRVLVAPPEVQC